METAIIAAAGILLLGAEFFFYNRVRKHSEEAGWVQTALWAALSIVVILVVILVIVWLANK